MKPFYKKFNHLLQEQYYRSAPHLSNVPWTNLITDKTLTLPYRLYEQAAQGIENLFNISHTVEYKTGVHIEEQFPFAPKVKNNSLLMGYDFHVDDSENLKLIEINTNASGFLISDLIYKAHDLDYWKESLDALKDSFKLELQLSGLDTSTKIFIVDEDITLQKMGFEFKMYKDILSQWGIESEIIDYQELEWKEKEEILVTPHDEPVRFIYNRYCDFLLSNKNSKDLWMAFKTRYTHFSPNPIEYFLLADKNRLIELTEESWCDQYLGPYLCLVKSIKQILIPTYTLHSFGSKDDLWKQRKSLFFKPKRSHGGKATYRGKNITKRVFESLSDKEFLVQKLTPPQEIEFDDGIWKYDLRFFVYKDKIQLCAARIYQGQVTNFHQSFGGYAAVQFT